MEHNPMAQLSIPIEILTFHLRQVFGSHTELVGCDALTGGARKKVFRLVLSEHLPIVVLLAWQNEKDYFGERDNAQSIRSDQQAPFLFQANTELLTQCGVKVPRLYYFDSSCTHVPFSFALVEHLKAKTFNEWKRTRPEQEIPLIMFKIRAYLSKLHAIQRDTYGTTLDDSPKRITCYEQVLKDTYSELNCLGKAIDVVGKNESKVRKKLETLYQQIQPRSMFSFIHDELGPDEHLLINEQDEIAIIDVDGCQFFDLEREHSYLKLRFAENYHYLSRPDLDVARMQFYGLCLHISAAHGHYRLLVKGFPDPDMLRSIYEWNVQQLLRISDI